MGRKQGPRKRTARLSSIKVSFCLFPVRSRGGRFRLGLGVASLPLFGLLVVVAVVAGIVFVMLVVAHIDVVQDHSENIASDTKNSLLHAMKHGAGKAAVLDDDDRELDGTGKHGSIA